MPTAGAAGMMLHINGKFTMSVLENVFIIFSYFLHFINDGGHQVKTEAKLTLGQLS